jgi:hypothetical protein
MTVGQLKKRLEGLPDAAGVLVEVGHDLCGLARWVRWSHNDQIVSIAADVGLINDEAGQEGFEEIE